MGIFRFNEIGFNFLLAIWLNIKTGAAADRDVSYYYPAPDNIETYKARMRMNVNSSIVFPVIKDC